MWNYFGYGVVYYAHTQWCTRSTSKILATGVVCDARMQLHSQIKSIIEAKGVPQFLDQAMGVTPWPMMSRTLPACSRNLQSYQQVRSKSLSTAV